MKASAMNDLWLAILSSPAIYKAAFCACVLITIAALSTIVYVVVTALLDIVARRRGKALKRSGNIANVGSDKDIAAPAASPSAVRSTSS
jgi:hypothetical protein